MPQRPKAIELTDSCKRRLQDVVSRPTSTARGYVRAKILLMKVDDATNAAVAETTVYRTLADVRVKLFPMARCCERRMHVR
ncbi:MAG: hypothetical protein Q4B54_12085 [Coriobacteriales bacterium]|nr:hypothetical protein [Coriobacteriales bacterium]